MVLPGSTVRWPSVRLPAPEPVIFQGLQFKTLGQKQSALHTQKPLCPPNPVFHRDCPEASQSENWDMKIEKISSDIKYRSIKPPPTMNGAEMKYTGI